MFQPGLHKQLAATRIQRDRDAVAEKSIRKDPRDSHEAGLRRAKADQEIKAMEAEIADCLETVKLLDEQAGKLRQHAHSSRHLSLALTHLEDSWMRIVAHLGEPTA
jgi:hypothetical protein